MISQLIILSPLGDLIALANETHLLMLEFADSKEINLKIQKLEKLYGSNIQAWSNLILEKLKTELREYFEWSRKNFTIPLMPYGTEFQMKAWKALEQIPYWETRNYLEEATMIGNSKAVRAIGGANHNNPIVIIIPCHRVIGKNGKLVGYGGWLDRKIWLLEHEKQYKNPPKN